MEFNAFSSCLKNVWPFLLLWHWALELATFSSVRGHEKNFVCHDLELGVKDSSWAAERWESYRDSSWKTLCNIECFYLSLSSTSQSKWRLSFVSQSYAALVYAAYSGVQQPKLLYKSGTCVLTHDDGDVQIPLPKGARIKICIPGGLDMSFTIAK